MTDLKPCPYWGSEAELWRTSVSCSSMDCFLAFDNAGAGVLFDAESWNRRHVEAEAEVDVDAMLAEDSLRARMFLLKVVSEGADAETKARVLKAISEIGREP